MKEALIELLNTFGYPVYQQGSYPKEEEYPEDFFTFWNYDSPETNYYDNAPRKCIWSFWVYFYSTNPALVNSVLEKARQLLKNNGWLSNNKGEDVASDYTTHTGRLIDVSYIEKYNREV